MQFVWSLTMKWLQKKQWLVIASIVVIIGLGYRLFFYSPSVEVIAVKQQQVQGEIAGPGTVQAKIPVSVSAKITGILQKLNVDQGHMVKQGSVLAELDSAELIARLEAARSATARARQDDEKAKASTAKAQANLLLAQSNYKRDREVFDKGYISQAYFDVTQAQLHVAQSEHTEALKAQDAAVAMLAQVEAEAQATEATLDFSRILAPMDGLITSRRAEIGDTITPGRPVFNMIDLNSIWVAAWIDQALIAHLKADQTATIRLRSGRQFKGRVARINKEADTVTRELEVDVFFEQLPEPLVIGEEAEVVITPEAVQGLAVPRTAVLTRDGKTGVFVVEESRAVFREISLGPNGKTMTGVTAGLKDGDIVIVSPGDIVDNQKIKPVEQKI